MESPFYEATHDIQTEAAMAAEAWQKGHIEGQSDGRSQLTRELCSLSDEELLDWKKNQTQVLAFLDKQFRVATN